MDLYAVGRWQRTVLLLILTGIGLYILAQIGSAMTEDMVQGSPDDSSLAVLGLLMILLALLLFACGICTLVSWWMLLTSLQVGIPMRLVFLLVSFVPLINLIMILRYSQKATKILQDAGVKVGLLGPNRATLRELKARGSGTVPPPVPAAGE